MQPSLVPPRRVGIEDAASFAGTTPPVIRRYEALGLLRAGDEPRSYGHAEVVRLLWILRMDDAGMAADDIREAFADTAHAAAEIDHEIPGIPGRMNLLSDAIRSRLEHLPEGSLRQADLDTLLVTERIFGELGAAVQAGRFIALATDPRLRAESDRVDLAEESLDDTIAVDDPRIAQAAADRHAFELALQAVIEDSPLAQEDEVLFDAWEGLDREVENGADQGSLSATEAVGKMPYDFSPARLRWMELVEELAVRESARQD
jgi:DNA-binding transcriptional MerR regulator